MNVYTNVQCFVRITLYGIGDLVCRLRKAAQRKNQKNQGEKSELKCYSQKASRLEELKTMSLQFLTCFDVSREKCNQLILVYFYLALMNSLTLMFIVCWATNGYQHEGRSSKCLTIFLWSSPDDGIIFGVQEESNRKNLQSSFFIYTHRNPFSGIMLSTLQL